MKGSFKYAGCLFLLWLFMGCTEKSKEIIDDPKVSEAPSLDNQFKIIGKDNFEANFIIKEKTNTSSNSEGEKWNLALKVRSKSKIICDSTWSNKDENKLIDVVLKYCMKAPHKDPESVNFKYIDEKFEPIDPIEGTKIDTAKLRYIIIDKWDKKKQFIDLTNENLYLQPVYLLESEKTKDAITALDKCLQTIIEYKCEKETFKIDHKVFGQWISLDTAMKIQLDFYQMQDYLQKVASKIERPMSEILALIDNNKAAINDSTQALQEITYEKVNIIDEISELSKLITTGKKISKEITFVTRSAPKGLLEGLTDFVEVSIEQQKLWLFKGGNLILETDVVTGHKNSGRETPRGSYSVKTKVRNRTLKGPGYSAFVSYWMPFYKGYGLHDANWRRRFGSNIYTRNGSHGCVNVPSKITPIVYANVDIGMTVIIN